MLSIYDPLLSVTCPVVWRCSRLLLLDLYNRNLGSRHLDIGPGTGYFLDECHFPVAEPRVVLADNSVAVLRAVTRRISRYHPDTVLVEAPELNLKESQFDSVAMLNFLHCLPGNLASKCVIFDHIIGHVSPGGRIFGCTILGEGVRHSLPAQAFLKRLNRNGMFHNTSDTLDSLHKELGTRFADYRIRVYGSIAFFEISV
jgi:2-polyprenyl-3-methyl-5-hydroxy-6-metoxy-1,4-benzoquinol methylase